jgi:hypothetical protein
MKNKINPELSTEIKNLKDEYAKIVISLGENEAQIIELKAKKQYLSNLLLKALSDETTTLQKLETTYGGGKLILEDGELFYETI